MDGRYCEREQDVVATLLIGASDGQIFDHIRNCHACSGTLRLAELLRNEAIPAAYELSTLPEAAVIWRKAQSRVREMAWKKATLPIGIVRTCACVLAILASPWLAFQLTNLPAWVPSLGLKHFLWTEGPWLSAFTGTTLIGFTLTLVSVGLSSWYMLRQK
jgi:hypothetical protein